MNYVEFFALKLAVAEQHNFITWIKNSLSQQKAVLLAPAGLKRFQFLLFFKHRKQLAKKITLFFSTEKTVLAALKAALRRNQQNTAASVIEAHRVYFDLVAHAIESGQAVAFIGFSAATEVRLKYNLGILHEQPRRGESAASIMAAKLFFLHRHALLQSSKEDIEQIIGKINPRLIICEQNAIISFDVSTVVAKLGCVLLWLDSSTLKRATRQNPTLPRRKKSSFRRFGTGVVGAARTTLLLPNALLRLVLAVLQFPFNIVYRIVLLLAIRWGKPGSLNW